MTWWVIIKFVPTYPTRTKMSCKHSFCQKGFPNMIFQVLHLKWLPNVFELWKLVHREAPEVHFFLTPGVGRLSVQLRQHNKLLCLILESGKKCCSGSLVWVNLNNSNESDLHSWWGTWFCMLEMRSSQRLMLLCKYQANIFFQCVIYTHVCLFYMVYA